MFETWLDDVKAECEAMGHRVVSVCLRDKKITYCTGCWACWVKTPGQCIASDDSREICSTFINSDFVLFASPVLMGFTSAILKRLQDKLIPLVHPYIEIVQGECHHKKRYDSYPGMGLVLDMQESDMEDRQIITRIYERLAKNLRTRLHFSKTADDPAEEVAHAIDCV